MPENMETVVASMEDGNIQEGYGDYGYGGYEGQGYQQGDVDGYAGHEHGDDSGQEGEKTQVLLGIYM